MLTLCLSLLLLITNNSNNSQITDKKEKVMKFELIQLPLSLIHIYTNVRKESIFCKALFSVRLKCLISPCGNPTICPSASLS